MGEKTAKEVNGEAFPCVLCFYLSPNRSVSEVSIRSVLHFPVFVSY
jgi:hypothetical protein